MLRAVQRVEQDDSAALINALTSEATDRLVCVLVRNGAEAVALEEALHSGCEKKPKDHWLLMVFSIQDL
ncbi:MAG: hypothetical protein M0038_21950 [Pseudomonadota bacterium]|nr:hypothetical protein [Pseudomonadota bacterium]